MGGVRKHSPLKIKQRTSATSRKNKNPWVRLALKAGWRKGSAERAEAAEKKLHFYESSLQLSFVEWMNANINPKPGYALMKGLSAAYVQGYNKGKGSSENGVPLLLQGTAAAVVCASSEEDSIHHMLNELERLPLQEIVVVLNGCRDNSYTLSHSHPLVTVVYYPELLGHDVGRSIGARLTGADAVLFCDGDMVIPAEHLAPFLHAVDNGCDAALNDLNGLLPSFMHQDELTHCKSFLNMVLGRSDLGANSLTAVPHALSGRLIREMDVRHLIVPPKAQALAILEGYRVEAVHTVDVFSGNRKREGNVGKGNAVADMIIGDHVEALDEVLKRREVSGSMRSLSRMDVALQRNAI